MLTVKELASELARLTNNQTLELVKELEILGFTPMQPQVIVAATEEVEEVPKKVLFNVKLVSTGGTALNVVKEWNKVSNEGLVVTKRLFDTARVIIKENISKEEAEGYKALLEAVGAEVVLE